jgi:hypothetical protein
MGFEEFLDMCPHTVTIEPFASRDGFGNPTYSAAVTCRARIQGKNKAVRTVGGIEATSSIQVYIGPTPLVDTHARLTLPTNFQERQPPILGVEQVSDENGSHHQVVLC